MKKRLAVLAALVGGLLPLGVIAPAQAFASEPITITPTVSDDLVLGCTVAYALTVAGAGTGVVVVSPGSPITIQIYPDRLAAAPGTVQAATSTFIDCAV